MFEGKSILITGGTGSFGKKFVEIILKQFPGVKKLVIFSRDELKQFEMQQQFSSKEHPCLRYFIGDVRDEGRLVRAFEEIDIVIHAAALKQVPAAEYNPTECIKTNVSGAENVINAALMTGVSQVVALSTDKAAAPINLYGATKLCSDKLFIAANNMTGHHQITFSVVRYGNVMGSRGSVIPFFLDRREQGVLPITHPDMTRFNISLEDGVKLVLFALENAIGGETFVPKIPSYRILDMATAIAPNCEHKVVGVRPGEKIHEEMVTTNDALNCLEIDRNYIIFPINPFRDFEQSLQRYMDHYAAKRVLPDFNYSSDNNPDWLTVDEIRELIKLHIDPTFSV